MPRRVRDRLSGRGSGERPTERFDVGLQHERTALAWERTAVAMMVAGVIMARYAASDGLWIFALLGLFQTVGGAALMLWAGGHYDELHGPLRANTPVVHPTGARTVGLATIGFNFSALTLAVIIVAWR
jgi:uncharacterized membrane protein YidH (DUF202 family)